jgi:hypothetical protein
MDIDRFLALLNDPAKSKQDLMTMRENAMRSKMKFSTVASLRFGTDWD